MSTVFICLIYASWDVVVVVAGCTSSYYDEARIRRQLLRRSKDKAIMVVKIGILVESERDFKIIIVNLDRKIVTSKIK